MILKFLEERKTVLAGHYARYIDGSATPLEQVVQSWGFLQSSVAEYALLNRVISYMTDEIKAVNSEESVMLFDTCMDLALRSMNHERHVLFHLMFAISEQIEYSLRTQLCPPIEKEG